MISVIIATYNCAKYVERALHSIFSQILPSRYYEVIVVDDGSTDDTNCILNKYKGRIKIILQDHMGLASACNRAIREAKGVYIIRLDADDYFDVKLLSSTLNILENNGEFACVYTDRYEINSSDNIKVKVSVGLNNIFNMIASGILFRKDVFDKIGLYRNILFEEYDLMLRFFEAGFKAYYLRKPLYYYVKRGSSITNQQNYWADGWKQLVSIWGEEKLRKYLCTFSPTKSTEPFCFSASESIGK